MIMGSLSLVKASMFKCITANRTLTTHFFYVIKRNKCWNVFKVDGIEKSNVLIGNFNLNMVEKILCKQIYIRSVTSYSSKQLKINTNPSLLASICGSIYNKQERNKSTKKSKKRPEYDSDSDSEDEDENIHGTKIVTSRMQSLRLDGLLKKCLSVARNKVETAFYEGKIRVNGKKPDKKSFQVRIGDEVDLIKGFSPMNSDFLNVARIEVISVDETAEEDLMVKVRRTKTLLVENYKDYPWKKESSKE